MNASIPNDWGYAVELAQQKIGMRPIRLANLLKGLGERPDALEKLLAGMPMPASKMNRSAQTMVLASGTVLFASIAMIALSVAPVVVPAALAIAAGSAIFTKQSSTQDKQRAAEENEAQVENRLQMLEGRAQSKLIANRMASARESLSRVKSRATDYGADSPSRSVTEIEVEEELSAADLNQFFKSLDVTVPDSAATVGPTRTIDHGVNDEEVTDVSGEEIASLFGVGGNSLFVSSSSPSL